MEKVVLVTLVRDKVRIEDQAAKLTVSKVEGETVGVIKIPSFYIGLTDDVKKLLVDAEKKKNWRFNCGSS